MGAASEAAAMTGEWPRHGGEMGERIGAFDWADTPLGPLANWPQSLRSAVDIMLDAHQPACIGWGPQLTSLYNSAYIAVLGEKHPGALGQPLAGVWPDVHEEYGQPLVTATLAGESQHFVDRPLTEPGVPTRWFTFSLTPLRDETSVIAGLFCAATDTTAGVRAAEMQRAAEQDALRSSETRYHTLFEAIDEGFCIVEMLFNAQGHACDYRFLEINPAFERHTGLQGALGRTVREFAPAHEPGWFEMYGRVARSGEPVRFEQYAAGLGERWFDVYAFRVGPVERQQVALLFKDISARKRVELALAASELRYRTLFETMDEGYHLGDVMFDTDGRVRDVRFVEANPAAVRLVGADHVGRLVSEVFPDFEPFGYEIWGRVARTGRGERMERYAAFLQAWYEFYIFKAEPGNPQSVRVAVIFKDISARKRAEIALRESEEKKAFLLKLSDALRPLTDAVEMQGEAARVLGEQLRADNAFYDEFQNGTAAFVISREYRRPGAQSVMGNYPVENFGPALVAELLAGRTLCVANIAHEAVLSEVQRRAYRQAHIVAFIAVPVIKDGILAGIFAATQATPREWTALEVSLVQETCERNWAAVERARAETALRAADRRKDEFLATLAHELRNPLAPLRNGLQIARLTSRGDATLQRTVEMMDRQLSHLVRLVDDLLDVARVSSGKLELRREPVDLGQVLASSVESTRVIIESHGHELVVDAECDELLVRGDFERLSQVFTNLLSNAAKYTERGGLIQVALAREDGAAVVRVIDSGIGIPAGEVEHVFDLFSQVRSHQGRTGGGLGIGLSLVKSLVALHEGQVAAHSAGVGAGSTFSVRLPLLAPDARSPPAPVPTATIESTRPDVDPRRILIADDNVDAVTSLARLLTLFGHEVWTAHDGLDALEKTAATRPDVVFLDLGMPRMDGIEAAQRIRALPGGDSILLIALTGWGQESDRQRTLAAGFDWHLIKPIGVAELTEILAR
jgi:signal transduction histidine kinase/CheY-like chemotaxis protein/PAS domain-containing protein